MTRRYWPLGKVIEFAPVNEDLVRLAKIRKSDGKVQEHSIKQLELLFTHSYQAVSISDVLAPTGPKRSTRVIHKKDKNGMVLIPMNFSLFRRELELENSTVNVC